VAKIFYNSFASEDVYRIIREAMPPGHELVLLGSDAMDERLAKIRDAEIVVTGAYHLRAPLIAAAAKLRLVHHQGVGYHDTVDVEPLKARGIRLALAPHGTAEGVAEHAIMMMLAAGKRLTHTDTELRRGVWGVNALRSVSREVFGKRVGIVGMGRIGQAVAERLKPWHVTILYSDPPRPLAPARERELGVERSDLDEILATCDIVTLHLPLMPETRHMIDARALARMKADAILVNCARGGIVDEAALYDALAAGRLLAAGVDVFEEEPPSGPLRLAELPNVILTPHVAAGTRDAFVKKMNGVFVNVRRFYQGEKLEDEVEL
jgi:phosphoglycerate dehydrogenase-like enzyme